MEDRRYDVALSFAGEQRFYVEVVARALLDYGVTVFYDELETAVLWGTDGVVEFSRRYADESFRVVMFISKEYVTKGWTSVERRAAMSRLISDPESNHILPVRFDDTPVLGLGPERIVQRADDCSSVELAELIVDHLISVGRLDPSTKHHLGEARTRAQLVAFTSMADPLETGATEVSCKIENRSGSTIDSVVVVVPDYTAFPDADPDSQQGCAVEIVLGPIGTGQIKEISFEVELASQPVFSELPYTAHLLWSDSEDNHWAVCGSRLRRCWSRARTC